MYLVPLKAALVTALQAEFDSQYPYEDFRNVAVGIEYPVRESDYPGIWVDYAASGPVEIAGIGHQEMIERDDGTWGITTRWRFTGDITMTVCALSSLERDRLHDEVIRIVGFSRDKNALSDFRNLIEDNDLVAMNINFDSIKAGGQAAAQGTPWGTDEVVYETSLSLECQGEFVGDPDFHTLVRLSKVKVMAYSPPEPEPAFTGNPPDDHLMPEGWNPYAGPQENTGWM